MSEDFRVAAIYRTRIGDYRCLVIGGRADMLAGRHGATANAISDADPMFITDAPFITLMLDEGVSMSALDPAVSTGGIGSLPRAYVEYPWAMKPRPLEGDREWDGWPWVSDQ